MGVRPAWRHGWKVTLKDTLEGENVTSDLAGRLSHQEEAAAPGTRGSYRERHQVTACRRKGHWPGRANSQSGQEEVPS